MRSLLENAAQRAIRYLEGIPERAVAPSASGIAGLAELAGALPAVSTAPEQVIQLLDQHIPAATMAISSQSMASLSQV